MIKCPECDYEYDDELMLCPECNTMTKEEE